MTQAIREFLTKQLATERAEVDRMNELYNDPRGYLDPEVKRVFGDRVMACNVNLPRLAADTLAQRLQVTGFRTAVGDPVDNPVTEFYRRLGGDVWAPLAMLEALVSGRSYFMVGNVGGEVVVSPESPTQVTVMRDPVSRRITAALKRYRDSDGYTRSVVMTADTIDTYASRAASAPDPDYNYSPSVMGEDMALESSAPNLLGVVPVVALVNRPRLTTPNGQSDLHDLEPLLRALGKILSDMLTASEAAAMPRRWTSIPGDLSPEQAKGIQDSVSKTLTSPGGTRTLVIAGGGELHEFKTSDLDNFDTAIRLLVSQIAAIASLPPYYVSSDTTSPTSADAIRASESRLTAKALERQRWWGPVFADLMRLAVLARDGVADERLEDLTTLWVDPAPASVAQAADAQAKLVGAGIVDRRAALEALGFAPLEVERMLAEDARAREEAATLARLEAETAAAQQPRPTRRLVERDDNGFITAIVEETA